MNAAKETKSEFKIQKQDDKTFVIDTKSGQVIGSVEQRTERISHTARDGKLAYEYASSSRTIWSYKRREMPNSAPFLGQYKTRKQAAEALFNNTVLFPTLANA